MPRIKTLQCKHIPDKPVLEFLRNLPYYRPGVQRTGTWYSGFDNSVDKSMPEGTPEKLVLAKMRSLITKGLVSGCQCGCRGDFELTTKGLSTLNA